MLDVRDLGKLYPRPVAALKGVSLSIESGLFGLLGPNGSGKTTLMRILAGLLKPTSGEVLLDGLDVVAHPERVRARLGYLPQYFGFYPNLSGRDMLLYMLRLKGVQSPRSERALVDELLATARVWRPHAESVEHCRGTGAAECAHHGEHRALNRRHRRCAAHAGECAVLCDRHLHSQPGEQLHQHPRAERGPQSPTGYSHRSGAGYDRYHHYHR